MNWNSVLATAAMGAISVAKAVLSTTIGGAPAAQIATLVGVSSAFCISAASLMKHTGVAVSEVASAFRDGTFVVAIASASGLLGLYQLYQLTVGDSNALHDLEMVPPSSNDEAEMTRRRAIERIRRRVAWSRVLCITLSGGVVVGVAVIWAMKVKAQLASQAHREALELKEKDFSHRLRLFLAENSVMDDWKRIWDLYSSLKAGTSAIVVFNDTDKPVELFAHHTWGLLGGAVLPTDQKTIEPMRMMLMRANCNAWGVGEGVALATDVKGAWINYKHGCYITASDVLAKIAAEKAAK